jgi:Tol biopolymer transport system component
LGLSGKIIAAVGLLAGGLLLLSACRGNPSEGEWKIVFPAARDGDWGLYVVGRAGGAPMRIAPLREALFGEAPVPSPDGRKLVLPSARYELVVMNLDGGSRKLLTAGDPATAVWSPDGEQIAFRGAKERLWIIGVDGGRPRRLTRGSLDGIPAWSPDGKRIAFARPGTGVMLVDPDASNLRVLRRLRGEAEGLHWSRDGRSLTFLHRPRPATAYARSDLVTVAVPDGLVLRRVPGVDVEVGPVAWSPDGRLLAYTKYGRPGARIVVMGANGSNRRVIRGGSNPTWSQDGRTIVYRAEQRPGGTQLKSVRPDGTGMRPLTSNYPNGVEPLAPGWVRGPVTPLASPYRLAVSPRRDGALLRTHFPVALLAASGSRVALVSLERVWTPSWMVMPPLVLWDARRGRTARLALPGCHQPESVAVPADRVAFECPSGHAASFGRSIRVFPIAHVRPFEIAGGVVGDGLPPARLPGRVAAGSDLLAFSTYFVGGRGAPLQPRLWMQNGVGKTFVARGVETGEPAAVDDGRIAVERRDGQVALVRRGRVLGRVDPGGPPPRLGGAFGFSALDRPTVGLSGRDLVVLRRGRLLVYDAESFRLRRSLRVGRRARLAGASNGLVAYVVATDIRIVRLRDGRSTTIRTTSLSAVEASLTSAGLFYATHTRSLPRVQLAPARPNPAVPATVVFLRRSALLLRLR